MQREAIIISRYRLPQILSKNQLTRLQSFAVGIAAAAPNFSLGLQRKARPFS